MTAHVHKWWDVVRGAPVDVTAETLPQWIAYSYTAGAEHTYHFDVGRAIAECHGLNYWTQPWAAHAGTLAERWTPEARTDAVWVAAWIAWYVGWVAEMQAKARADTGIEIGEDLTTPGWRKPA